MTDKLRFEDFNTLVPGDFKTQAEFMRDYSQTAECPGHLTEIPVYRTYNGRRYQMTCIVVCKLCNLVIAGIDTDSVEEVRRG